MQPSVFTLPTGMLTFKTEKGLIFLLWTDGQNGLFCTVLSIRLCKDVAFEVRPINMTDRKADRKRQKY